MRYRKATDNRNWTEIARQVNNMPKEEFDALIKFETHRKSLDDYNTGSRFTERSKLYTHWCLLDESQR